MNDNRNPNFLKPKKITKFIFNLLIVGLLAFLTYRVLNNSASTNPTNPPVPTFFPLPSPSPSNSVIYDYYLSSNPSILSWKSQNITSNSLLGIALSSSGQYQTAVDYYGNAYISKDFGNTWKQNNISTLILTSIAMDKTGQYQTISATDSFSIATIGIIYLSKDYGNTWSSLNISNYANGVTMSSDSKYQTVSTNGFMYVSSDKGLSWSQKGAPGGGGSGYPCMSSNGKYQIFTNWTPEVVLSNDFGNTFTVNHVFGSDIQPNKTAMSSSGQYQLICCKQNTTQGAIIINGYFGNSSGWASYIVSTNPLYGCAVSSNGLYQTAVGDSGAVVFSLDYGFSWNQALNNITNIPTTVNLQDVAMSSSGQYQTAVDNKGNVYTLYINAEVWGLS